MKAGQAEFKVGQRVRIGKHTTVLQFRLEERDPDSGVKGWFVDPPAYGSPYWQEGMMKHLEE